MKFRHELQRLETAIHHFHSGNVHTLAHLQEVQSRIYEFSRRVNRLRDGRYQNSKAVRRENKERRRKNLIPIAAQTLEKLVPTLPSQSAVTIYDKGRFRAYNTLYSIQGKSLLHRQDPHTGVNEEVIITYRPFRQRADNSLVGQWVPEPLSCSQAHDAEVDVYPFYKIDSSWPHYYGFFFYPRFFRY